MTDPRHAVASDAGPHAKAGQTLFLVQGALQDPAKVRAQVDMLQAMHTPVQASAARVREGAQAERLAERAGPQAVGQERAPSLRMQA